MVENNLSDFDKKLREAQAKSKRDDAKIKDQDEEAKKNAALYSGLRTGMELTVSMIVGGAIGYGLDHWLGTLPLFMITMFLLGTCAGFWNIYKASMGEGSGIGFKSQIDKIKQEDKDSGKSD